VNALLTEGVAANGSSAVDNELHADRAVKTVDLAHGLFNSSFQMIIIFLCFFEEF